MSTPPYPFLPGPFQTENLKDDDPEVIDSLIQATTAPADIKYGIQPEAVIPQFQPVPVTKLFTATTVLAVGADPYPLLPEDVNRLTCRMTIFSLAVTPAYADYVLIGDNRGATSARNQNYLITGHHAQIIDLDAHTGQVWVIPGPSIAANIEITAYGVTSYDR
jgi:hypothetical protein